MRPPKEVEGRQFHWVRTTDYPNGMPLTWACDTWFKVGRGFSPEIASRLGWVWLGVAEPPSWGWGDRGA